MANGDIAAAAGLPIVAPTELVKQGYDEINLTRDLLVNRTPVPVPLAKGGTGATTVAQAQTNLGLVPSSSPSFNTVIKRDSTGVAAIDPPRTGPHIANKSYVDATVLREVDTINDLIQLRVQQVTAELNALRARVAALEAGD